MPYIKDLENVTGQDINENDLLHVWNTNDEVDESISVEELKKVFGSGVIWSGTLDQYEEAASTIENETVVSIYDDDSGVTPASAGVFYKINDTLYPVVIYGAGGTLAIKISNHDYNQLTYAQKHDTTKMYFVYDRYTTSAEIDDENIGTDKVWSSSKTAEMIAASGGKSPEYSYEESPTLQARSKGDKIWYNNKPYTVIDPDGIELGGNIVTTGENANVEEDELTQINSDLSELSKIESLDISGKTTDTNGHILITAPSAGEKPLNGWAITSTNSLATVETFKDASNNWYGILKPVISSQSMSSVTISSGEIFWFK